MGSCRVHGPMREIAASGRCHYVHGGSRAYLHSVGEALQRLNWGLGARAIDDRLAPYCFATERAPCVTAESVRALESCDLLLLEISSAKELLCDRVNLQLNYLHRHLLSALGETGAAWWREVVTKGGASRETAEKVIGSRDFMERGFSDFDATVLREMRCVTMDAARLDVALAQLRDLWRKPIVIVTHVGLPLKSGARLAEREAFIGTLRHVCANHSVPCFEPSSVISVVGRAFALEDGGEDLDHFHPQFEPIYGWYLLNRVIGSALSTV